MALPDPAHTLQDAVAQFRAGDLDAAGRICTAILAGAPDETGALQVLGAVRLRQGDAATAVDLLARALRRDSRNAELMANLGAAHRAAGDPARAADVLRKAVRIAPNSAAAHLNFANALTDIGDTVRAERHYRRTLQIEPAHAGARRALAELLYAAGREADALAEYEAYDAAHPGDGGVLNAVGALRAEAGDFAGAGTALRAATAADPGDMDAAANLANVLACLFRHDEALALYGTILGTVPESPDLLSNMGNVCRRTGDTAQAEERYARALALDPDHLDANAGLAACRLADGRFGDGWAPYLRRESVRAVENALYRGRLPADLAGRTVAALADQGLGDEIFFLRFAPALRARGATVLYRPEPRLAPMLARAGIVDGILPPEAGPEADFTVAVGDLPHVTGMTDGNTPPPSIALTPDEAHVAALRAKLEAFGPAPWIGVTWRAGTANRKRLLFKEAPADGLSAALPRDGSLIAIQRGAAPGEIDAFAAAAGRPVLDLSDANDDLEDLLALAGLLDVYVAVSNTTVHLRAAQGRPTHVLVPAPAEFRWMAAGGESPWFPGSPVYRQAADGDWRAAFDALKHALGG